MFYKIKYIIILCIFISCKEQKVDSIQGEVKQLTTYEQQSKFLEQIADLDQKVRNDETVILQKYGYKSKEHNNAWDTINKVDSINLVKIEAYLEKYSYPSIKTHTKKAISAPWIVIHHKPSKATSTKHFKTLYKAYKKGDLEGGLFTLYLGRFYDVINNTRLDLVSPYTEEFEVDTLIKALDLVNLRDEVAKELEENK
jgi:ribosomal protein S12